MAKAPGLILRSAGAAPRPSVLAQPKSSLPPKGALPNGAAGWRPIDVRNPVRSPTQTRVTMGIKGAHFEPEPEDPLRYNGFALLRLAEDHKAANPKDLVTLTLPGVTRGSEVTVSLRDSVANHYVFSQTTLKPGSKAFVDAAVFFERSQLRKASVGLAFEQPSEYPNMRATSTFVRDNNTNAVQQTLWVDLRGDGSVAFDLLNPNPALSKSNLNLHGLFGLVKP